MAAAASQNSRSVSAGWLALLWLVDPGHRQLKICQGLLESSPPVNPRPVNSINSNNGEKERKKAKKNGVSIAGTSAEPLRHNSGRAGMTIDKLAVRL